LRNEGRITSKNDARTISEANFGPR